MSWPLAFRHFNPFDESQHPNWGMNLIIERAMRYVGHRSMRELQYGLETLHTLQLKYGSHGFFNAVKDERNKGKRIFYLTHADNMREAMKEFDIDGQSEFPNATWPEYFALLALAHIGERVSTIRERLPEKDLSVLDPEFVYMYVEIAIEAMDALGEADALAREERVRHEAAKQARRAVASRAAKQRLEPYHAVRMKCLAIYENKYQSRSNRDAARRIYENDLSESERAILRSDDPRHQIEKWIGAHLNKDVTE